MTTTPETCEIVVVGGGPAGCAIGGLLAAAGREVTIVERDRFPRDKLCGEFLSHEARDVLRALGVLDAIEQGAPRIDRASVYAPSGACVRASLPSHALGVSRVKLDALLWQRASELGATCIERATVRDVRSDRDGATVMVRHGGSERALHARVVVGSWGRRTSLDRRMGRDFLATKQPWMGLKQHHTCSRADALHDVVELHAFDGGYCGMSRVEGDRVNVCALIARAAFERAEGRDWAAAVEMMRRSSRTLDERFAMLSPTSSPTQAVAEIPFMRKSSAHERCFWVGDAAGMITPMTGDGQAMAMESASLLAPILLDLLDALERCDPRALSDARARWEATWNTAFGRRHWLGRALQALLVRPTLAQGAIQLASHIPRLPEAVARATRG